MSRGFHGLGNRLLFKLTLGLFAGVALLVGRFSAELAEYVYSALCLGAMIVALFFLFRTKSG